MGPASLFLTVPGLISFIERHGVLSAEQCRRVVDASLPHLSRSTVGDARLGAVHPGRTSSQRVVGDAELAELLLDAGPLERALLEVTGAPPSHREPWRVVRYEPGQQYTPHCDWYAPDAEAMLLGGQRVCTAIVYLCDVAAGGLTDFPRLRRSFSPELGKLLSWRNVGPDGRPLGVTVHAGTAPVGSEKWILTSWYRQETYAGSRP